MFQSLFGSLLNHLYRYGNENVSASLLNLHHLYFNYHLLTQKLFSLWKILPYLGSFRKNFVKFKKNKYVIYQLRVSPYGEKL